MKAPWLLMSLFCDFMELLLHEGAIDVVVVPMISFQAEVGPPTSTGLSLAGKRPCRFTQRAIKHHLATLIL